MTQTYANTEATRRTPRFASSKFLAPGLIDCLVPRPRLFDALDAGTGRHLTLVVGSPGAGKTTLLANWLASRPDRPTAWLSCDNADGDPRRFVAALIEAMRRGFGDDRLGASAVQLLELDGEVSMDLLAVLSDDLETHPGARVLVIDDFHLAAGSEDALADFLLCRPSQLQVVLTSRSDPSLRLHRMRTLDDLVELGDSDLAFSLAETRDFFSAFGLDLSDEEVQAINRRTEGWSTGMQMVALTLRASSVPVADTPWSEVSARGVAGYFMEEVLSLQPEAVVDFMLATSVLDELSVPGCAALVGDVAAGMLDHLLASHLFVTVADERAHTYRYHQLIKAALERELHLRDPQREADLRHAAASYLLQAGHAASAARQLLAAGESQAAFDALRENLIHDVLTNPTTSSALDSDEFRPEMFAGQPEVLVPLAAELLWRGAFDRGSRAVALARLCPIDPLLQPNLAVQMAFVNTQHHAFVGEFPDALAHRETVRTLTPTTTGADDWIESFDAMAMYCDVYVGDYRGARELADELAATTTSSALGEILCTGVIGQAALLEGALDEAATLAARSLDAARRLHFDHHPFAFHALRTLGQLALERRDLDGAIESVERALSIVSQARPAFNFAAQLDRARMWAAGGDRESAIASLPDARASLRSEHSALLAEADELEARLRMELGDPHGAMRAACALPPSRRSLVEAILALAVGDTAAAEQALASVTTGSTIRLDMKVSLLSASVALSRDERDAPIQVRHALENAYRLGFLQTVLETAPQLIDHVIDGPELYAGSAVLAPFTRARHDMRERAGVRRTTLIEPLTDAEMRVLAKLAEHLSYAEMAAALYLSMNTVKTHLRHAYMKLGVSSRSAAIARATALGLL